MKLKMIAVLLTVFIIALFGCTSTDAPGRKILDENTPEVAKTTVEAKKNVETPITNVLPVVCDKFVLVTNVSGTTLNLSVDTDLPDNTVVIVGVSRSYLEKGNSATYAVDYFSERSTIGKWKSEQSISIASEDWKKELKMKQEEMSRLGLGFDVESISNKIEVQMVVPINQPDSRFGDRNQNLSGKAVSSEGLRVIEAEKEIDYPLNAPPVGKSPFPNLDPMNLDIGQTYTIDQQTPLMPSHSPDDPLSALEDVKNIPIGGVFKVLEIYTKDNNPWYKVTAFDPQKNLIGTGWINSIALLGQKLKADN